MQDFYGQGERACVCVWVCFVFRSVVVVNGYYGCGLSKGYASCVGRTVVGLRSGCGTFC